MKVQCYISLTVGLWVLGLHPEAHGQQTPHVSFDRWPPKPPGTSQPFSDYFESGVGAHATGRYFVMRWPGDPLFPDNGTAYIQSAARGELFFDYFGGGRGFAAVSVDLALYSVTNLEPVAVQFRARGYNPWEIIATTTFTVTGELDSQGRPAFQTFYFPPEFRNMTYLNVTPTTPLWSLDNLVIYIPEPSSWALLALGAAGFALARRRKAAAPPAGPCPVPTSAARMSQFRPPALECQK